MRVVIQTVPTSSLDMFRRPGRDARDGPNTLVVGAQRSIMVAKLLGRSGETARAFTRHEIRNRNEIAGKRKTPGVSHSAFHNACSSIAVSAPRRIRRLAALGCRPASPI